MHEMSTTAMSDITAQRIRDRHGRASHQRLARTASSRRAGSIRASRMAWRAGTALTAGALAAIVLLAGCSETRQAAEEPAEAQPADAAAPDIEATSANGISHCRVGPDHQPC